MSFAFLLPPGDGLAHAIFAAQALGLVFGFGFGFGLPTAFGGALAVLAFPCFVFGLFASPLCGAALTFFAAAKKVSKESGLTPPARSEPSLPLNRKRPNTRPALAPHPSVTKHSSAPAWRVAPRRQVHPHTTQLTQTTQTAEFPQSTGRYARPPCTECVGGMDECFVTSGGNAGAGLVFGPLRGALRGGHLQAGGVSPLSLLTFFAAAKKVSAAPHRGEANRPLTKQGKANAAGTQPNAVGNPKAKQGKANAAGAPRNAVGNQNQNQNQKAKPKTKAKPQTGVAIISALLVVALSAILVSGILWRQQVQIRRIENQRLLSQAQWISRGALDWTRLILRSEGDTSAGITYLGGVWGVPIAKTRLSDFLGQIGEVRASEGAATYLSGSIEDAQSKFNLRNLVSSPVPGILQLNVEQIAAFQRLLVELGLSGQLAQSAAVQLRNGLNHSATRFQSQTTTAGGSATPVGGATGGTTFTDKPGISDDDDTHGVTPLQMTRVDSLLDVPGFTPEMIARLRPFVTYLPTNTAVNMNTAPAEVIAAVVPGMSLSNAQAFVARRQTVFFHNVGDVQLALQGAGVTQIAIDPSLFDVTTSYFYIHGRVDHERAEVDRTTLVFRDPLTHTTRIVRVQDQL